MGYVTIELDVDDCPGVNYLEHVSNFYFIFVFVFICSSIIFHLVSVIVTNIQMISTLQVVSPIHVSAGRKRGDLRIYLTSPAGTRSTLLDARPQDYMSSGFIDWPFMTTHSWGENPRGKWFLEIHNDAYSKWASDAKFFRWTLELYGIEFDPNSEEYKMAHMKDINEEKLNVVREASQFSPSGTSEAALDRPRHGFSNISDDIPSKDTEHIDKIKPGCISKRLECTQNLSECRAFSHETVANLFCKCSQICANVSSLIVTTGSSGAHETVYHMGCSFTRAQHQNQTKMSTNTVLTSSAVPKGTSLVTKKAPFYCQFIPFFSY